MLANYDNNESFIAKLQIWTCQTSFENMAFFTNEQMKDQKIKEQYVAKRYSEALSVLGRRVILGYKQMLIRNQHPGNQESIRDRFPAAIR